MFRHHHKIVLVGSVTKKHGRMTASWFYAIDDESTKEIGFMRFYQSR